jgi:hypothetical protein
MRQRIQSCPNPWLRACAAQLAVAGHCTWLALLHGSVLVVACPTAVTCHTHVPITQRPVRLSHQIKGEEFQTHSFIHSFIHSLQRSKQSCQSSNSSVVSPCTTAAMRLQSTGVQPRICREELATATQVALEAITPICYQHLTTLHMTAQQSVRYTHENSTITSSHTN